MSCGCRSADRYASFIGLDCDGKAHRLMAALDAQLARPGRHTAFWTYFAKKRAGGSGPRLDELFLIHAHLQEIREFFEIWDDTEALALLDQVEKECC